jgi:hypothetical protein
MGNEPHLRSAETTIIDEEKNRRQTDEKGNIFGAVKRTRFRLTRLKTFRKVLVDLLPVEFEERWIRIED